MAEPSASAQFRMDLNMDRLFQQQQQQQVDPSSSTSTFMEHQESGESDSIRLNAYSLPDIHHDPLRASESSSSSSLSQQSASDFFSAGMQGYQEAPSARNDQAALVKYGTALEHFQTALAMSSSASYANPRHSNQPRQQQPPPHNAVLFYQALCLRAMARLLATSNPTAALALWDQALECLELVLGDCHRYSCRLQSSLDGSTTIDSCGNVDACMVEILREKATALMKLVRMSMASSSGSDETETAQHQFDEAMDSTTQALKFLLDLGHFEQTRNLQTAPSFVFTCLDISQHSQLLIETVQQTIQQYREQDETLTKRHRNVRLDEEPVWMQRAEQALHVLQTRQYELTRPQRLAMASIQEELSHVYLNLGDLERGSQAISDACDWLLEEQQTPPTKWLDRMEHFGTLLEQEATTEGAFADDPDLVDIDAAAALDLAMSCFEKSLLLRNQCGLQLAAQGAQNTVHEVAVANALSHVARVMQLQGNDEGSMDLFRAAAQIYSRQTDYAVLAPVAIAALQAERWDQAVAVLSQCVELTEAESASAATAEQVSAGDGQESQCLDNSFIYFSLAQAYIGRRDYVSATICLMEAIKYEGKISEQEIYALLQRVEFLRREEHNDGFGNSLDGSEAQERSFSEYGSSAIDSDGEDDEGTAFYDSESVSAFHPPLGSRGITHSASEDPSNGVNVILDLDLSHLHSERSTEGLHEPGYLDISAIAFDATMGKDCVDDESPPAPVVSPDTSFAEGFSKPPTSPVSASRTSQKDAADRSLDKASSHSAAKAAKRFGSPLRAKKDQDSVGDNSQRSGLARAIANTFRLNGTDRPRIPPSGQSSKPKNRNSNEKCVTSLPSEEEFHSAVDNSELIGPLEFVNVPQSNSFDSDISSITVRIDEQTTSKDREHDLWWGAAAEGLGRWLPTVVNTAVEAAEGFLSARSIHSQKKRTPLFDYATSEDSDDENDESADILSRPAVADSKTQLAVRGSRASFCRARKSPTSGGNYDSGALSLYSGHRRKVEEVESEIERHKVLIADQEKTFGRNHLYLANSLFALAVLHSHQGAAGTALAIDCATEALRIQKECGTTDDASRTLHFLADLYLHQKQYSSSLACYGEALRMEQNQYGQVSDEAAKTLNRIGTVHAIQSDFGRAMECHQEALRLLQASHGEDIKHPLVSETLCQIGSVYYRERNAFSHSQSNTDKYTTFIEAGMLETIGRAHEDRGSYKLAISFFEERLAFLENSEPAETLDMEEVAETLNSLGMLSSRAGRLVESLDFYEKSLRIQLKLGCDAVQLATIRVLTGSVHFQLGDLSQSLRLHQDALKVLVKELGREHATVAAAHYQIGLVHAGFYQLDKAMESFTNAVEIQERLLGVDHPATLRSRREIGNLYANKLSECDAALQLFDEILNAQRAIHGDRHPNIAETLFCIGRVYARRGNYASALQILEQSYHMRTEFLGHDVPVQATTLYEISLIHMQRKHIKRALQICDVVMTIREETLRDTHIDIALTNTVKGSCFVAQNRLEDAEKVLTDALEMGVNTVGDWHPSVAEMHLAFSSLHLKRCQFEEARLSAGRALEIYERVAMDDDEFPAYKESKEQLARIEHDESLFV